VFLAKVVYNMPATRSLLDRLATDSVLRRICDLERLTDIPDESLFSCTFAEFSGSQLPKRVHAAFIKESYANEIVGHNLRNSMAIETREKPSKKEVVQKVVENGAALNTAKNVLSH
jgi:site-specific recombinase XerC